MGDSTNDNFESVLEAATALLHRRQRVTYGAFKRQLGIDDAYLADLKDELILARRVAADEDGKLLVWVGGDGPASTGRGSTGLASTGRGSTAERRHLTVMFCDMVGSTSLSGSLDPEELGALLHAYQTTCNEAITPFEGYVAQYLGDGILTYFGFPRAHEDDAERCVLAALGILDALTELNRKLSKDGGPTVAVRIGIHTGLVLVDEMGVGTTREHLAVGEVPNVAARIQGLGEPNTVLVSADTHKLVDNQFNVEPQGACTLAGVARTMDVYRVVSRRARIVDAPAMRNTYGRDAELLRLDSMLDTSSDGEGQVVLISGEAGIGKSHYVAELRERAITRSYDVHVYHCSPHAFFTPLHPVAERLRRGLGLDDGEDPLSLLETFVRDSGLERASAVPLLCALLSVEAPVELSTAQATTNFFTRMQALIEQWLMISASRQPTLLIWEDLHWADPTTMSLLGALIRRCREASVLIAITFRSHFEPPWDVTSLSRVKLGRLERDNVAQIISQAAHGRTLTNELLEEVLTKTDGVPLFAEELTKAVLDAGASKVTVPSTLQGSLMARLDQLGWAKEIAQLGATVGREFSEQLIADISNMAPERLTEALDRLVDSGLVLRSDRGPTSYRFKHALVQDAAYEAILRGHRPAIHQRIAEVLESKMPQLVAAQPELLAHHLTLAGLTEQAVDSWLAAGRLAAQRSANVEAVAHFERGIETLAKLDDEQVRLRRELDIQIPRAGALRATKGFAAPATGAAFERARELCLQLDEQEQLIPALNGIYSFHLVRNQHDRAGEAARELLVRAKEQENETYQMVGHRAVGAVLLHTGDPRAALPHLQESIGFYDFERHKAHAFMYGTDHKETACCFIAVSQFLLGLLDQAYATHREALAHAERLEHAHSIAQAVGLFGLVLSMNREPDELGKQADRLLQISTVEHKFPYFGAVGDFWRAHANAMKAPSEATIERMRVTADHWQKVGGGTYRPYLLTTIGEAHHATDPRAGMAFIDDARKLIENTNERFSEPELHRAEGELLVAMGDEQAAETSFQRALTIARERGLSVWERRAAISLATLWRGDRAQDARALLAPIQQKLTEGAQFSDHQRGAALLRELS